MGPGLWGWTAEERPGSLRGGVPPPPEAAESREDPQPEEASLSEGRFLQWLGHRGHGERFRDKREVAEVRGQVGLDTAHVAMKRGREMLGREVGTGSPVGSAPAHDAADAPSTVTSFCPNSLNQFQ